MIFSDLAVRCESWSSDLAVQSERVVTERGSLIYSMKAVFTGAGVLAGSSDVWHQ